MDGARRKRGPGAARLANGWGDATGIDERGDHTATALKAIMMAERPARLSSSPVAGWEALRVRGSAAVDAAPVRHARRLAARPRAARAREAAQARLLRHRAAAARRLGRGRGASNSRAAGAAGLLAESACALDQRSDDAGGLQLRTGPGCTSRVEVRGAEV